MALEVVVDSFFLKRLDENREQIERFVQHEIPAGRFGRVEEVANVVLSAKYLRVKAGNLGKAISTTEYIFISIRR